MIPLTLAEVARATDGRLDAGTDPRAVVVGPVVADSREAVPGALFVALPGERCDGHDHAPSAVERGAVAVLAARSTAVPAVLVDDPLIAVGRLARAVLERLADGDGAPTVVGITGSSGKTGTKDMLAGLLGDLGPTVAPEGSFNNELGLPLTVLRADPTTRFLVAEMGARAPGDIDYLCGIVAPRIGVVLNIGAAHAGVFGDRATTARTKGELVSALPPDGLAVLNADDPLVRQMADRAPCPVVLVGRDRAADVRAQDVVLDGVARPSFLLVHGEERAGVRLALHGEHHVANALAAAAVALHAGAGLAAVAQGLSRCGAGSRWRMEVTERADGVVVVNDAYNANPDSVAAALRALTVIAAGDGTDAPRRSWAVLGEMLELGGNSAAEHTAAGELAARLGVSRVVGVGPLARDCVGAATRCGTEALWVPDAHAASDLLREELGPGDVVLVKASRDVGLESVARGLLSGVVLKGCRESAVQEENQA
ncbi:MAG: UDP-N-acetylmuramoyl-tripeptide--D-alanyl-D-alanine ligase [Actinomycetota bacterium]|nr:UDP-N-acetylmuramoyl-tripeptide--D-alanyl-D-alanine ligase [Actinomycetota bacterium]